MNKTNEGLRIIVAFSGSARVEVTKEGKLCAAAHEWLSQEDHDRMEALGFNFDTTEHAYLFPEERPPDERPLFLYAMQLRPPKTFTLPRHFMWRYVTAPAYMLNLESFRNANPGIPLAKPKHPHGVISSEQRLSPQELESFQVDEVLDKDL